MKKIFSLLVFASIIGTISSQELVEIDGNFLTANNEKAGGSYETFYNDGSVKAQYNFVEGKEHGPTTIFHSNGTTKEIGTYNYGTKVGEWKSWDEKGNVTGVVSFNQKGERDGIWEVWDEKGTKRAHMEYANGKRDGKWKTWTESGNLEEEKSYK